MDRKKIICIVCPIGCQMEAFRTENASEIYVTGNMCKRGEIYGIKEMTNPTRILTTTIKLKNSYLKRLPVRTDAPVPKEMIAKCMMVINKIEASAPVRAGTILLRNIVDTGVNIISSRSI